MSRCICTDISRSGRSFDDPDPSLREEAVYALGRIASASTLPLIRRALADEKLAVREAAEELLSELASEP